jgi:hypothetical protein
MSIEVLTQVLPLPQVPHETGTPNAWEGIEQHLGIVLPSDYKDYINMYGTGMIGYLIRPLNPFSDGPRYAMDVQHAAIRDAIARNRDYFGPVWLPFRIHPDSLGLLMWGNTIDGDALFWHTHGRPEQWKIILIELRSGVIERFNGPITQFIARFVQGKLRSTILPKPRKDMLFIQ